MQSNYYSKNAQALTEQYNSQPFDSVHADWLTYLPQSPGFALDVGAGSGRDARALSSRGWTVYAVEPNAELRSLAQAEPELEGDGCIHWLDDALPSLKKIRSLGLKFDLILVSAVWMHIADGDRERAVRVLSELLAPQGRLVMSLRCGLADAEREFHPVSMEQLQSLAANRALVNLASLRSDDKYGRDQVHWQTAVFMLPDNGTGALPLLRHIIVNDNKSSSYKLGLLRVLTQLADGLPGIALAIDDDWVVLPFGVVGLYWLKQYLPLLSAHNISQQPGDKGYGFVKNSFHAISANSSYQLSLGRSFTADAPHVMGAIRDACQHIQKMPAHFTTWPGTADQVFEACYQSPGRTNSAIQLDKATLEKFGTFRVPRNVWDCMSQYAVWIEPAIRREWVKLMRGWNVDKSLGELDLALDWPEAIRDTSRVRKRFEQLKQNSKAINCVWSGKHLQAKGVDIDHCFPWAHWQNNDLWNLLPAKSSVNLAKSDKLPSAALIQDSRQRIIDWWECAYLDSTLKDEFLISASSALPGIHSESIDSQGVYQALLFQRDRMQRNQQLQEWNYAVKAQG